MNEKQNKSPCDCRQSTGESKEEASRSQRRHPGEQQTHYYLLWKPSHAWGFLSSGKEWLDMTTQLDTERHTSTDLWGKELKMKYWRHSSVNSPHTLKRLRRQFGLQHYIFFSFPWLLEKVAVKEKCNWTAAYLSVLQLKSIQKERLKRLFAFGSEGGYLVGRSSDMYTKWKSAWRPPLLTFPCCPPLTQSALVGSPFGDASQNTFWFEICFSVPWRSHGHLLQM